MTVTIGQIANQFDIPPRDVLDAALATGVSVFWHEGQQFRSPSYLQTYLAMASFHNPLPELQFDLDSEVAGRLADKLGVDDGELSP